MKKIGIILFILIFSIALCSCSSGGGSAIVDNDQKKANENFEQILEAIQAKDKNALISLFSKDCIENAKDLDESILVLFKYFEGEIEEYDDWGGPYVETTKENNQIIQIMEVSYDLKTSVQDYRVAVRYVTNDTTNISNIGLQSLYIIKTVDDSNLEYAYWGDGKFAYGINIGIKNG